MAGGAATDQHSPATGRLQHGGTAAWNRRMHPGGQFSGQWIDQGCVELDVGMTGEKRTETRMGC